VSNVCVAGLSASAFFKCRGFVNAFFSLISFCNHKHRCKGGQTPYDRRDSIDTLSHPNQHEPTNDGNEANDKGVVRSTRLAGDIARHHSSFKSLAVRTLLLSHHHKAFRAVGDDVVILGEESWRWERTRE